MKALLLAVLLTICFASFQAHACSCAEWEGADELLQSSDALVLGVPTDDGQLYSNDPEFGNDLYRFGIKVVKKFKGRYSKFMYLVGPKGDGANCGLYMNKYDGLHLISAYKVPGQKYYVSDSCSVGYVLPNNENLARIIEDLLSR